ncbi:MAG TPA: acyl-CoA dehydrogenase [Bryobacteraceae bacterium]|nr:acyl-CoA dehydrogenase [Bryobacteraceae bacterium]
MPATSASPPGDLTAVRPLTALSEEELMFRSAVREFARVEISPHVRSMDEQGVFRKDLLDAMFQLGLMAIEIPEEFGGQGGTFFQSVLAVEELAAVDPSVSVIADVHNTLVVNALLRWGTVDQKRRYLPLLAAGTLGAYALSEASSGSDAFALAARAKDLGDRYRIEGRKLWITNAAEAGLFLVFANLNPDQGYKGITCFLLERSCPGLEVGRKEDKLGIRASSTCELILDGCEVAKEDVLGEAGRGYKIAIETLNEGRIGIGGQMVGLAQGAFEHAVAYAKQRKQFGKTIGEFQGVQFEIAQMAVDIEAARLLVYNAARLRDSGMPFVTEAAMAKYFASQIAETVASRAIEVLGGVGFTRDYPVEKFYRDAKIGRIYEGTSNMQKVLIAKRFLDPKRD